MLNNFLRSFHCISDCSKTPQNIPGCWTFIFSFSNKFIRISNFGRKSSFWISNIWINEFEPKVHSLQNPDSGQTTGTTFLWIRTKTRQGQDTDSARRLVHTMNKRSLIIMSQALDFHATGCTLNRKSFVVELMYFIRALIKNHFSTFKKCQKVQDRATTIFLNLQFISMGTSCVADESCGLVINS